MSVVLQECTHDLLAALQINGDVVAKDILSLKGRARKQACDWLHQFCRGKLADILASASVPCQEEQLRETFVTCGALMKTDCREPRWHLLYVDILLAKGEMETLRCSLPDARWHRNWSGVVVSLYLFSPVTPHSCCYDTAPGEDKAAGAHLRQVFGQEPRDAVAQARVGVVEAAQHNYGAAARRLSRLAEKDAPTLDWVLTLIPPSQRKAAALVR